MRSFGRSGARPAAWFAAIMTACLVAACGGKVVVEEDPPDLASDCTEFCKAFEAAGCGIQGTGSSCTSECDTFFEQGTVPCEKELSAMMRCTTEALSGSDCNSIGFACLSEAEAYAFCMFDNVGSTGSGGGFGP